MTALDPSMHEGARSSTASPWDRRRRKSYVVPGLQ